VVLGGGGRELATGALTGSDKFDGHELPKIVWDVEKNDCATQKRELSPRSEPNALLAD
jgi:hypothetical protein